MSTNKNTKLNFKSKKLKKFYNKNVTKGLDADHIEKIRDILASLEVAETIEDMRVPTYNLHKLKGDREGQWSVTVHANWRVTFFFENGQFSDINYEDYHEKKNRKV